MHRITVLPSTGGHAAAQGVFAALRDQRLDYDVQSTAEFLAAPRERRASMVVALVREFDLSTIDLVRTLRRLPVPTFLVVEELTENDEVSLLHSGVFDVVAADKSPQVVSARLRTMYHHVLHGAPLHTPLEFANVTVRPDHHEVLVDGKVVSVTLTEFRLLVLLAGHPDQVLDREELAVLLGNGSRQLSPRALECHVSRLRLKIAAAGGPRLLHPVRGFGYRLLKVV